MAIKLETPQSRQDKLQLQYLITNGHWETNADKGTTKDNVYYLQFRQFIQPSESFRNSSVKLVIGQVPNHKSVHTTCRQIVKIKSKTQQKIFTSMFEGFDRYFCS